MAELSVKVPIRFSEKAQKDLYETCMAYKELAEMRGAENEKLRELVKEMRVCLEDECKRCHEWGDICDLERRMSELGIMVQS